LTATSRDIFLFQQTNQKNYNRRGKKIERNNKPDNKPEAQQQQNPTTYTYQTRKVKEGKGSKREEE
jgi:hypothetical protein